MAANKDKHPYIVRDNRGIPIINGSNTPVGNIVEYVDRLGYEPEKVAQVLKLTPAQVNDALSFYQENKEEIDQQITEGNLYFWYQRSRF